MKRSLIVLCLVSLFTASVAHAVISIQINDAGSGQIELTYSGSNTFSEPFLDSFIRYRNETDFLLPPNLSIDGGAVGSILISVDGGAPFAPSEMELLGSGVFTGDYIGARSAELISGSLSVEVVGSTILSADFSQFVQGTTLVSSPVGPIQLTVGIPEPSTYVLLFGVTILCVVALRRRR